MPLYEYQCCKCKNVIEEFHSINNIKETINCKCGYTAKRIISKTSFILNGKGWAADGYTKENK